MYSLTASSSGGRDVDRFILCTIQIMCQGMGIPAVVLLALVHGCIGCNNDAGDISNLQLAFQIISQAACLIAAEDLDVLTEFFTCFIDIPYDSIDAGIGLLISQETRSFTIAIQSAQRERILVDIHTNIHYTHSSDLPMYCGKPSTMLLDNFIV
jgi:hypothetical protein